jgi:hypothetical protein
MNANPSEQALLRLKQHINSHDRRISDSSDALGDQLRDSPILLYLNLEYLALAIALRSQYRWAGLNADTLALEFRQTDDLGIDQLPRASSSVRANESRLGTVDSMKETLFTYLVLLHRILDASRIF